MSKDNSLVRGTVKNSETGELVPYAMIYCKELKQATVADLHGFFYFNTAIKGEFSFNVSSLGYKDLDTLVKLIKNDEITLFLEESELTLDEVVVTAQISKEQPTSSVIKQEALRHLQPNSFADILELIPGGITTKRGMTSVNLISLRQPIATQRSSNYSEEHNTSLGTAFIIDGIPISNDAQLGNVTGSSGYSYITGRNATGKGVDMRMISTDDIEKVEIVQGIPSVKYGDLTSGMVTISRSYTSKPLRVRVKATPSVKLAALSKGFNIGEHTLNANLDYVDYLSDPRNVKENYSRATASLRYANTKSVLSKPLFFSASIDYTGSFDKSKRDDERDTENENFKNKYHNVRFSSRLFLQKEEDFFDKLEASFAFGYTDNRKIINRIAVGRMSPILTAKEDGEYYGKFLPSSYPAHLEIDDKPFYLYSQLNSQFHWDIHNVRNKFILGADWRFSKNFGEGEIFDIKRPLFSGNGRPRRSKDIPALQNLSFYVEDNTTVHIGKSKLNIQLGVRGTSLLGMSSKFENFHHKLYYDPRTNLSFEFPQFDLLKKEVQLTLHGGFGWHTKMPTLSHLYPNKIYYDKVQFNYYSQNASLRQMQYKVKVIDPTNHQLKPNRNKKIEVGFTARMGKISLVVNGYKEIMNEGFRHLRNYDFFDYKRYDNESGPKPSELSKPPTVDMFAYDSYRSFILYSQYTNGGVEEKKGVEYTLNFGNISTIKSDVSVNGAWMQMQYGQSLPRYQSSSSVIGGKDYPYIGYYDWDDSKSYEQFNTNIRFDTKLESLGLIFSSTFQTIWYTSWQYTLNNGMPTYYIDFQNNQHPYTSASKNDPVLRFLYEEPKRDHFEKWREPIQIDFNLKVSKRINKNAELGFYVNRILHYYADFHRPDGFVESRDASPYFGMELNIKL